MAQVLYEFGGTDFTKYVKSPVKYEKNDVDSNKAVRVKQGANMRRDRLGVKRKMEFEMMRMPFEVGSQLGDIIGKNPEYTLKYVDLLEGIKSGQFYTSTIKGELNYVTSTGEYVWDNVSFDATEI